MDYNVQEVDRIICRVKSGQKVADEEIKKLIQDVLARTDSDSMENAISYAELSTFVVSLEDLMLVYISAQGELQNEFHKLKSAFDRHEKDHKALEKNHEALKKDHQALANLAADRDTLLLGQIASKLEKELVMHLVSGIDVLAKNEDVCYFNLNEIDQLIEAEKSNLTEAEKTRLKANEKTTIEEKKIELGDRACIRSWKNDRNKPAHPEVTLTEAREIVAKSGSILEREKKKAMKYLQILEDFKVNNLSTKF